MVTCRQRVCHSLSFAVCLSPCAAAGFTVDDMQEAMRRRLSRFDSHVDPTPDMFTAMSLGAPPVDVRLQDGSSGEPIVTIILQMEGVLFKKEYDVRFISLLLA